MIRPPSRLFFRRRVFSVMCLLLAASAVAHAGLQSVSLLDYAIVSADYSAALERIVILSRQPDRLNLYDPMTGTADSVVLPLPGLVLTLSPDGRFAAVAHDRAISYVDLTGLRLEKTIPVTVSVRGAVLGGNGFVYIFSTGDSRIRSVDIGAGLETAGASAGISAMRLHPAGRFFYTAGLGTALLRVDTSSGIIEARHIRSGPSPIGNCSDLWISKDGLRIFTRCGQVFRASEGLTDLSANGSLRNLTAIRHLTHAAPENVVLAIPDNTSADMATAGRMLFYDYETLLPQATVPLPAIPGSTAQGFGRYVFSAAGGRYFVIIQEGAAIDPAARHAVASYTFDTLAETRLTMTNSVAAMLRYNVLDAEYSKGLDRLIIVSDTPDSAMRIIDPAAPSDTKVIPLAAGPAVVSVSPDGFYAAVGHATQASYVDLRGGSVVRTYDTGVQAADIVLAGSSYMYVFPAGQSSYVYSVNLATGSVSADAFATTGGTLARLHPSGRFLYGATNNVSPESLIKFDIGGGRASVIYDTRSRDVNHRNTHPLCGNLWFSEDGSRIFTACGRVFDASEDRQQDMGYSGALQDFDGRLRSLAHSAAAHSIASVDEQGVFLFDESFGFIGHFKLPHFTANGRTFPAKGKLLFFDTAGSRYSIVIQADESSGLLFNTAVISYAAAAGAPPPAFVAGELSGTSLVTRPASGPLTVGYGSVQTESAYAAPAGLAIFGFRQNGILVTEASVPASAPVRSGRLFAESQGSVNTGLAIANPNPAAAGISYYFTSSGGERLREGSFTIAPGGQIASFLNESPFELDGTGTGTLTFDSTIQVAAVALRGFTNERSEFLITTLPILDLSAPVSTAPVAFAHFADGGGWTTELLLVNPSNETLNGRIEFFAQTGNPVGVTGAGGSGPQTGFAYSIPAATAFRLSTAGLDAATRTGSVIVTPAAGHPAPQGLLVFSYRQSGITVTTAGVPGTGPASVVRMYGKANTNESLQTGLAVLNSGDTLARVTLEMTRMDGTPFGSTSLSLPPRGQTSFFLNQLNPGFTMPPFEGILRVSTSSPSGLAVTGLRSRYNERGDFITSTIVPAVETEAGVNQELFFPHIVSGGGYTTQFVIFGTVRNDISVGVLSFRNQSGEKAGLDIR